MTDGAGARVVGPARATSILQGIDLFAQATPQELDAVAEVVEWVRYEAGTEVFAQGDRSDGMYFVVRGRLECLADGQFLREIGRGGILGELALLVDDRRTATVRALRDSLLVRLPHELVPDLFDASPALSFELARLVARRAVSGPAKASSELGPRSVAVVSLDPGLSSDELADHVARRLGASAQVGRVDAAMLSHWYDTDGLDEVVDRLAEDEDHHDTVVVTVPEVREREGLHRELVSLVLRQMDLVVVVTRRGARLDAAELDMVAASRRPVTLVVVHASTSVPHGTARLLDQVEADIEVRDHVHIRDRDERDLDRLARIISGRSVGVVLGGGGSRGFAHLGVVRALREAGVPIDRVGGSSMGAIMSGQVAQGWSVDEMLERNAAVWSRRGLVEFGLPTLSLLRGRRAVKVLEALFGDRRIEDLWLDYFCTTVDLSSFHLHVARRGRVADWARASATVPGLWPPLVDDDGHLHVDGGVLDNVPTDIMRAGNVGAVIGVDVCKRQSAMTVSGLHTLPTGLAVLVERRRNWVPTIIDVLNRSSLLASLQTHQHAERYADVFLAPPVEDEGFAAFDRIGRLAQLGYEFAVEQLEQSDLSSLTAARVSALA